MDAGIGLYNGSGLILTVICIAWGKVFIDVISQDDEGHGIQKADFPAKRGASLLFSKQLYCEVVMLCLLAWSAVGT